MASKRKSDKSNSKNSSSATKRGRKKKENDYEDELSDDLDDVDGGDGDIGGVGGAGIDGRSTAQDIEILIPNEDTEPPQKLPEELLETYDKGNGKLLIAGMVTWELTGKRNPKGKVIKVRPNLYSFYRFTDEQYRAIFSGCASAHSVLINMDRKALTFGRNANKQLGQPESITYEKPTLVPGLENLNIIHAACGRHHTLFLTDTGTVYACGDNRSGQCGVGSSQPTVATPTKIKYRGPPIIRVGCGAEFSVILDIKGNLYTFGLPEYGQLGHNTDGKYFINANKLTFHFETAPKKIVLYIEKSKEGHVTPVDNVQIVDFACGNNHTVAIDSKKRAYSWGFGGFGRLGHAEQKDEMVPRLMKYFVNQGRGVKSIYCGSSYSLAITDVNILMLFGQNKKTGEANMYPKPVQDLAGWNITDIGCSYTSIVISADDTLIAWGVSPTYGELGLGEHQKSSSVPKEVNKLSGMKIPQVTCGYSHTLLLVNTEHELTKEKYSKFPEFTIDD